MIFDETNMFSDAQAIHASVASDNTIDLGPVATGLNRDIGNGTPVPLRIQVVEDFAGNGNVTVQLETADTEAFQTPALIWKSDKVPVQKLKAGFAFTPDTIAPKANHRYLHLYYTVDGSVTAGKVTAGITLGNDSL